MVRRLKYIYTVEKLRKSIYVFFKGFSSPLSLKFYQINKNVTCRETFLKRRPPAIF